MPRNLQRSATSLVLRGSLIALKRRCGKPGCRCARRGGKGAHETPALSYSVDGTTGILTLREGDVPEIRSALSRYKAALAKLEKDARSGITFLRKRLEAERARRRDRGRA